MLFSITAICSVLNSLYITHELFPQPSDSSCTWIYIEVSAQWRRMEADATYCEDVHIRLSRVFFCFFALDQSTTKHAKRHSKLG